jgi:chromosome segregation protein
VVKLRDRLAEIERILAHSDRSIQALAARLRDRTQSLTTTRDQHRTQQLQSEQAQTLLSRLTQQHQQLRQTVDRNRAGQAEATQRLQSLSGDLPGQDEALQALRQQLAELEKSPLHNEWQQRQSRVQSDETELQQQESALRSAEQQLRELEGQVQRLQERLQINQSKQQELRQQQTELINQQGQLSKQRDQLMNLIAQLRQDLAVIEQKLGSEKEERDRAERLLREQQGQKQQLEWQLQKVQETQQEQRLQLQELQVTLAQQAAELPQPLPEIPEEARAEGVAALQHNLRLLAKRIQAMEPVNMLALEEHERTEKRLAELREKLATLESERTELMLRIENFTTLRQRAFMEAYEAVNENFKEIFASLSDGEGCLQLDDPEHPLDGGLTLIAHPKGKAVRRLASMSGGEKSLTALSFIFALQRYRPSPFYSFDEVDSFLDGANVERLSRIIRAQSDQAQFIVVSHRRPMIEAAHRTIGVTQARGAHTQVLGISQEEGAAAKQSAN